VGHDNEITVDAPGENIAHYVWRDALINEKPIDQVI
jgi:hypothetical protein